MVEVAFVVLREMSELLLILAAVLGCATHVDRPDAKRSVLRAAGLGIALGAWVVTCLPSGAAKSPVNAFAAVVMGMATSWVTVSMLSSNRSLTEYVESRLPDTAVRHGSKLAMMGFCTLAGFRETLEAGVFLKASVASQETEGLFLAALLSLAVMVLVGRSFKAYTSLPSMLTVFRMSTVVLCFLSVRLSLQGLSALIAHSAGHFHEEVRSLWSQDKTAVAPYALVITLLPGFILLKRWWMESSWA